jgi:hypothetical protein
MDGIRMRNRFGDLVPIVGDANLRFGFLMLSSNLA